VHADTLPNEIYIENGAVGEKDKPICCTLVFDELQHWRSNIRVPPSLPY